MNSTDESRMVVVSGVPEVLPTDRMLDKLMIHFQSSRSHGGDVADIRYATELRGVAFVTFEKRKDADRVVKKKCQIMTDREFPKDYHLTVFRFSPDVYFYVTNATVDLSIFSKDEESLIQSLQSEHRSVRILSVPQERRATVEGPFAAIRALREDLIGRAGGTTDGDQIAVAELRYAGVTRSEDVVDSSNLEKTVESLRVTGEVTGDQTSLSYVTNQTLTTGQRPNRGERAVSNHHGYIDDKAEEEEQRAQSKSPSSTVGPSPITTRDAIGLSQSDLGYGAAGEAETLVGDVFGAGEMNVGFRSLRSVLDQSSSKDILAVAENIGCDNLDPYQINAQNTDGPDQTSTATMAELLHTSQRDRIESSQTNTGDVLEPDHLNPNNSALRSQAAPDVLVDEEEESIWVDSNTFRYIRRFDAREWDRCSRMHGDVFVRCEEGADLTLISLSGRPQMYRKPSEVRQAAAHLKGLVENWQSALRVHSIDCEGSGLEKVRQICDEESKVLRDVLYTVEESYIKVIGPSSSSHLFCEWVKDRITKLEEAYV